MKLLPARSSRLRIPGVNPVFALTLLLLILAALPLEAQRSRPRAAPYAAFKAQDTIYWYDVAPFTIPVMLGPMDADKEINMGASLRELDPARNLYTAYIENPEPGVYPITARAILAKGVASDEVVVIVEKPTLYFADERGNGTGKWKGLSAEEGEVYDPSSEWASPYIPNSHYQTVVTIKGSGVMNRPGTSHRRLPPEQARALTITTGTMPEDIVTYVYWKPNGTADRTKWVLLLSNQADTRAVIPLEDRMRVHIPPTNCSGIDGPSMVVSFSNGSRIWGAPYKALTEWFGPRIDDGSVECADCANYGIRASLRRIDTTSNNARSWRLEMMLEDFDTFRERNGDGKVLDVVLRMRIGEDIVEKPVYSVATFRRQ